MTPDETAQFHSDRPGYELLDYTEVSLPVYKLTLRVLVLQHTPLSPIFEFVLKAIRLGVDGRSEIARCLGIPDDIVDDTLTGLLQSEEIEVKPGIGDAESLALTMRGEKTVNDLERIKPERQTIRPFFDGLTRQPIDVSALRLLKGRDAENLGMREIPAIPTAKIQVQDIDLTSTARILSQERKGEGRRDLLAINAVERRMRMHRPAVAMVFREIDGGDVEILFADDATMLEDHNRAFAIAEGSRKLRLLEEFVKPEPAARTSFAKKMKRLHEAAGPTRKVGRKRTLSANPIVAIGTARPVTVHEHPRLLWDAVDTAKDRLLIICPWITAQVVDRSALVSFEKLLKRGIRLYIGYGIDDEATGRRRQKPIPKELESLADRYESFALCNFGDTHEKVLIKDNDFEAIGSFNWLSFRGDPNRKLRHERSVLVSDKTYVEAEFALFLARFQKAMKRHKLEPENQRR